MTANIKQIGQCNINAPMIIPVRYQTPPLGGELWEMYEGGE